MIEVTKQYLYIAGMILTIISPSDVKNSYM